MIIGTVTEIKGPSNVGVLNFFNWTQQTHQHWINVEITLIVNIHQCCCNVDIWLKMKVEPTYICRCCFNVDKTTSKQCWWNYVDSTSMNQRCFNIEIWLRMKVEPTYVYRRCNNVDKTTLKQPWKNYIDSMLMTQCCFNVDI